MNRIARNPLKDEKALQIYIEKGAMLGHEDEVRKFLESRIKGARESTR